MNQDNTPNDLSGIPLETARSRLAGLWFTGAGLLFGVLVVQSILGKWNKHLQEVFSWFIPTVIPTLSLMISVIGGSALASEGSRQVRVDFFRLAWWLSVVYLLILGLTIGLEPFSPMESAQLFTVSNYWLAPIQGLVVAALGFLFTRTASGSKARQRNNKGIANRKP